MKIHGITEREAKNLAKDMMDKSISTQKKVRETVMDGVSTLFHAAGLATKKDVSDLKKEMKLKKS